jgi:hypothetical protein
MKKASALLILAIFVAVGCGGPEPEAPDSAATSRAMSKFETSGEGSQNPSSASKTEQTVGDN